MVGDGFGGEEELVSDGLIVLSLGDEGKDFPLSFGEDGEEGRGSGTREIGQIRGRRWPG